MKEIKNIVITVITVITALIVTPFTSNAKTLEFTTEYDIPNNRGFKSYMDYKALNDKESAQYELQQSAETNEEGLRVFEECYCIAVGSYIEPEIGQKIDLVLENGTVINCIVGDVKADSDTDKDNIFTPNGCCSEFIIDNSKLDTDVKNMGNVSFLKDEWNSPVVKIISHKRVEVPKIKQERE